MALQAKVCQIVYCSPDTPAVADTAVGKTTGLVAKFKLGPISEDAKEAVAFLWKEKENCLTLAKEDVEIESKVWDVVQPVTDGCFEVSGRKIESTAAVCLYNFGYSTTGEALKKAVAQDFSPDYAVPFGNLPGLIVKVFLNNFETNLYGGFYLWDSVEAMHGYVDGKNLLQTPGGELNVREMISTRDDMVNQSFLKFSGSVI